MLSLLVLCLGLAPLASGYQSMDPCVETPCKNEGICLHYQGENEESRYACICPKGFTGDNCEWNDGYDMPPPVIKRRACPSPPGCFRNGVPASLDGSICPDPKIYPPKPNWAYPPLYPCSLNIFHWGWKPGEPLWLWVDEGARDIADLFEYSTPSQ